MNHIADNQDALLDYLYEEGDPAERLTIAKHLQECAACAVAVLEFQNVRGMLSDWSHLPRHRSERARHDRRVREHDHRGWGPTTTQERSRGWGPAATRGSASGCRRHSVIRVGHGGLAAPRGLPGWSAEGELAARCVGDAADHSAARRSRCIPRTRVRAPNDSPWHPWIVTTESASCCSASAR